MNSRNRSTWPPTIGGRIKWLLDIREITQVQAAARCGITQAAISNLVTDASRKPSAPTLLKLANELNASANWIITGEGSPFEVVTVSRDSEKQLLAVFRELDAAGQQAVMATAKALKR